MVSPTLLIVFGVVASLIVVIYIVVILLLFRSKAWIFGNYTSTPPSNGFQPLGSVRPMTAEETATFRARLAS